MRITVHLAMWLALAFAALCIAYGLVGFNSIDADTAASLRDDARGYAWFWIFMGGIGLACAAGSWWLLREGADAPDE